MAIKSACNVRYVFVGEISQPNLSKIAEIKHFHKLFHHISKKKRVVLQIIDYYFPQILSKLHKLLKNYSTYIVD